MAALVAHKYMPQEIPPEELRATFVAREHTLEYLTKALRDQAAASTLTSYLITGPRGVGKTTLILMLCQRIFEDPALGAAWLPIRFPEEHFGISSLRDLLTAALERLTAQDIPTATEWYERVEGEADDARSLQLAITGLHQISKEQGKRLILFIENLDMVFARALDRTQQATLRRLLMVQPFMMIMGTAVSTFDALRSYSQAFFNYFSEVPLESLSETQVLELLVKRSDYDRNDEFKRSLLTPERQSRIVALLHLTGGNPRLVLMLYEILSHRALEPVVLTLRRLVDELTPLLKDILEGLPHQQSKIVDALMRAGGTATPSDLAQRTRLRLNAVTTQLSRLKEGHIVTLRGGGKGQPAYYTIPDRLFSTWYQMRYLRPNQRRIEMFVDVLRIWFEAEDRLAALELLAPNTEKAADRAMREAATTAEYFAASLSKTQYEEKAREIAVACWLRIGDLHEAALALAEFHELPSLDKRRYEASAYAPLGDWSVDHGDAKTAEAALRAACHENPADDTLRLKLASALLVLGNMTAVINEVGQIARHGRLPEPLHAAAASLRGRARQSLKQLAGAIEDYTTVVNAQDVPSAIMALVLSGRGECHAEMKQFRAAAEDFTQLAKLDGVSPDAIADALYKRGDCRRELGDLNGAIEDFSSIVSLEGSSVDRAFWAVLKRAICRVLVGSVQAGIEDLDQVIRRDDAPIGIVTMAQHMRADFRWSLDLREDALRDYTEAIERPGAPRSMVASALVDRAKARLELGDFEGAIQDSTSFIEADQEARRAFPDLAALAFFTRGMARSRAGTKAAAFDDWLVALNEPEAGTDVRIMSASHALRIASVENDAERNERVIGSVRQFLSERTAEEQTTFILSLLQNSAQPEMRHVWPQVWRRLVENQSKEVSERLLILEPVVKVLEDGNLVHLDALPPEQREFAEEVLTKFVISNPRLPLTASNADRGAAVEPELAGRAESGPKALGNGKNSATSGTTRAVASLVHRRSRARDQTRRHRPRRADH